MDIPAQEQRDLLARVGVATEPIAHGARVLVAAAPQPLDVDAAEAEALVAIVPTWRRDLAIEADVAEEVARIRGYELIPDDLPDTPMPPYRPSPLRRPRRRPRGRWSAPGSRRPCRGRSCPRPWWSASRPPTTRRSSGKAPPVAVRSPSRTRCRASTRSCASALIGSLLEVAATNLRQGRDDIAIFEIGKGYGASDDGEGTHEWWRLGFVLTGPAEIPAWNRPARPYDLDDAKGVIELVARSLGLQRPVYTPLGDDPTLHPGRAAMVVGGDELAGRVGELHPSLVAELGLRADRVIAAELAVAGLSGGQPAVPLGRTPSRHPVVERDLAVVVADDRPAGEVEAAIRRHAGPLLASVDLFDIYRGRPLPDDRRSLAFRLVFAADRTLTEDEVDRAVGAISTGLAADVDGHLRT